MVRMLQLSSGFAMCGDNAAYVHHPIPIRSLFDSARAAKIDTFA
jgi:hypothetical protein